ncbi:MAG TPA: hypothetical protein VFD04_11970 [Actinomycetes bacterium]|nr:hypothetical protein [Actinomycetes bacterium]
MDRDDRDGSQRTQIGLLALRLLRVVWPAGHQRREVANRHDLIVGQKAMGQGIDVQPLVRSALEGSVVKIETVDVDDGGHGARILRRR